MMKKKWEISSEKFLHITTREQTLVLLTGLFLLIWGTFTLVLSGRLDEINQQNKHIKQVTAENKNAKLSIDLLADALKKDPNDAVNLKIKQHEQKLGQIDKSLLALTSALINPVQMRHALVELLKLDQGVKLISFEVLPVKRLISSAVTAKVEQAIEPNEQTINLFRHSIKLKLRGSYFNLRNYLSQLEGLSWKFFWKHFEYQVAEYPNSELEIEIYSLSTEREFIGT